MNINRVSIDLAKNVFQLCATNKAGKPVFNKRVSRNKLLATVLQLNPPLVFMESCYTANYWGRVFQSHGLEVKLIPAQFVKPFVRGNKNDHNDALAIAEASERPELRFVPIKSEEQQQVQFLHRVRQRHIRSRTGIINQLRGILSEWGYPVKKSASAMMKTVPSVIEDADNGLPTIIRRLISRLFNELKSLNTEIDKDTNEIKALNQENENVKRLKTIPGFGDLLSSALVAAIGNGAQFKNGRDLSAWLGLTPTQHASGQKSKKGGISKRGDRYLRTLFIHGARAAQSRCKNRHYHLLEWADKICHRSSKQTAWVALANKMARVAWAVLTTQSEFDYRGGPAVN